MSATELNINVLLLTGRRYLVSQPDILVADVQRKRLVPSCFRYSKSTVVLGTPGS